MEDFELIQNLIGLNVGDRVIVIDGPLGVSDACTRIGIKGTVGEEDGLFVRLDNGEGWWFNESQLKLIGEENVD